MFCETFRLRRIRWQLYCKHFSEVDFSSRYMANISKTTWTLSELIYLCSDKLLLLHKRAFGKFKRQFFMEWLSRVYYNKFLIWPDWLVKTCSEYARKPLSNMMKKLCSRLPRWFQTHVYQPIGSAESERLSESLFRVSKETIKERNNRFSQSCFIDSKQRFNKQRFNYSAVPYHSPLPVCVLITQTTM